MIFDEHSWFSIENSWFVIKKSLSSRCFIKNMTGRVSPYDQQGAQREGFVAEEDVVHWVSVREIRWDCCGEAQGTSINIIIINIIIINIIINIIIINIINVINIIIISIIIHIIIINSIIISIIIINIINIINIIISNWNTYDTSPNIAIC